MMWFRLSVLPKALNEHMKMVVLMTNSRQVHTTPLAKMPRGLKAPLAQTDDKASDRWKRYVEKPPDTAQPCDNHVVTNFGSIRLDRHNVPRVRAHDEVFDEASEKMIVNATAEKEFADPNWPRIISRARSGDTVAVSTDHDVTHRNFFFENDDNQILTAPSKSFEGTPSKAVGFDQAQKIKLAEGNFSYKPGRAKYSLKAEPNTLKPILSAPSTGSSKKEKASYSPSENSDSACQLVRQDLSNIDEQYFGALRDFNSGGAALDINAEELAQTRKLVEDSTGDLSFLDSQIFPQEPKVNRPSRTNSHDNSLKGDPKPLESKVRNEMIRKSKVNNEKDCQVLTAQDLRNPPLSSAMGFVQKLRVEKASGLERSTKAAKDPADEIGVSLKHKLETAANKVVSSAEELKKESSVETTTTQVKSKMIRGRLDERFLPRSLFNLTSIEVLEILKQSIVFDNCEYQFLIYGRWWPYL
jgi:hypothetical protein